MPENRSSTSSTPRKRRGRRVSVVPREVVMGIDQTERQISFVGGGLALVLAVIILGAAIFEKHRLHHFSIWVPQFLEILVFAVVMLLFAQRAKRAGVAVCALFLGLALGTVGFPFLLLGGWLIVRAFRLQKYGDATFKGSNLKAREMAKAKKEGRDYSPVAKVDDKGKKVVVKPTGPPAPSKRYTPKKRTTKR